MEQVTGLTAHMVRYRREKPEYKKFLESAMKERKAKALEMFKPKVPPSTLIAIPSTSTARPTRPNIPSTSKSACLPPSLPRTVPQTSLAVTPRDTDLLETPQPTPLVAKRKASTSPVAVGTRKPRPRIESEDRLPMKIAPLKEVVPPAPPAVTTGEIISSKRKRELSSPSGTPSPQRPRFIRQNTSPAAPSEPVMTTFEVPNTPSPPGIARGLSSPDLSTVKSAISKLQSF
ncbi:hypothetical protein CBL_20223 [Carabus blaptoides fortunei]